MADPETPEVTGMAPFSFHPLAQPLCFCLLRLPLAAAQHLCCVGEAFPERPHSPLLHLLLNPSPLCLLSATPGETGVCLVPCHYFTDRATNGAWHREGFQILVEQVNEPEDICL